MKILCAPDSYKGCLSASRVAAAMQVGIGRIPATVASGCPIADGGEGTAEVLAGATSALPQSVSVTGPLGDRVGASFFLQANQSLALMDMASAAGLSLVDSAQRDVMRSTTYGVGEMLLAACESGARQIIIGVGGSASNDGGCGMAQAIGVRFMDATGAIIPAPMGGIDLLAVSSIDMRGINPAVLDVDIIVACDVDNVLTGDRGAARTYAAQKGAGATEIGLLDRGLANLAAAIRRNLGIDVEVSRAGAAGGLAAGLLAFTGASLHSGIDIVLDAVRFDDRVSDFDLCLTGEGRLDGQSLSGKAC
ncbi:MAG: glycerate kinase, partial [Woeseiaceae bacterium]|nr:glycerate kinase [Woeseiaceae bacterium]